MQVVGTVYLLTMEAQVEAGSSSLVAPKLRGELRCPTADASPNRDGKCCISDFARLPTVKEKKKNGGYNGGSSNGGGGNGDGGNGDGGNGGSRNGGGGNGDGRNGDGNRGGRNGWRHLLQTEVLEEEYIDYGVFDTTLNEQECEQSGGVLVLNDLTTESFECDFGATDDVHITVGDNWDFY
jgi:hypothetical protein